MIDEKKLLEKLEALYAEYPYKEPGNAESYGIYNMAWRDCVDRIIGVVTAMEPVDEWTPCEKAFPEKTGDYLVTILMNEDKRFVDTEEFLAGTDNRPPEFDSFGSWKVIAWMEKPKPWRE